MSFNLEYLKQLEGLARMAVASYDILPMRNMTNAEKRKFELRYGQCDMVLGDFTITRISSGDSGNPDVVRPA